MTHSFDKDYWDQVWQGDRAVAMVVGQPNPHLVREVSGLTPGTALEAGCGAGTEAIWLATRGWQVTAADIAEEALARGADRATASGTAECIQWVEADLSTWEPGARYDLVTTHYAHPAIPQLEFYDRIADWVVPGGTLLIVAHLQRHDTDEGHGQPHGHGRSHGDGYGHGLSHGHQHGSSHESGHQPGHGHQHGSSHEPGHGQVHGHGADAGGPPHSASVTAADITARLDPAVWEIHTELETQRTLTGPGGREVSIDDAVVRATRRC